MNTLREHLTGLEDLSDGPALAKQVVEEFAFAPDGALAQLREPINEDDECQLAYEVGPVVRYVPLHLDRALQSRYGGILTERDRNLIASGAELVVRMISVWAREDAAPQDSND